MVRANASPVRPLEGHDDAAERTSTQMLPRTTQWRARPGRQQNKARCTASSLRTVRAQRALVTDWSRHDTSESPVQDRTGARERLLADDEAVRISLCQLISSINAM